MHITIDPHSGFCFGVVGAIAAAEEELERSGTLYCLGDIVHNSREVERLTQKGLRIIDHEQYRALHDCKVLIRAHGEPPETYRIALQNNIELIDASCAVVLRLQNNIRNGFEKVKAGVGQVVIFGKQGHAEVNGLVGQTGGKALIIGGEKDLDRIDYSGDILLYAQTTMNSELFDRLVEGIRQRIRNHGGEGRLTFVPYNTVCRQVSGRTEQLERFAASHDVILFVSDPKSSNGTYLYETCKRTNPRSYFISGAAELKTEWFEGAETVGISGATSTPVWVMEEIQSAVSSQQ
jgi:4-hydroxy-3-methylbut-2-enyl diphosphate reductase